MRINRGWEQPPWLCQCALKAALQLGANQRQDARHAGRRQHHRQQPLAAGQAERRNPQALSLCLCQVRQQQGGIALRARQHRRQGAGQAAAGRRHPLLG